MSVSYSLTVAHAVDPVFVALVHASCRIGSPRLHVGGWCLKLEVRVESPHPGTREWTGPAWNT
jgi:hypothetical protein